MECDVCHETIRRTDIHWRVYMSDPCKVPLYRICADCRPDQRENLEMWESLTGGRARWYRAAQA